MGVLPGSSHRNPVSPRDSISKYQGIGVQSLHSWIWEGYELSKQQEAFSK